MQITSFKDMYIAEFQELMSLEAEKKNRCSTAETRQGRSASGCACSVTTATAVEA